MTELLATNFALEDLGAFGFVRIQMEFPKLLATVTTDVHLTVRILHVLVQASLAGSPDVASGHRAKEGFVLVQVSVILAKVPVVSDIFEMGEDWKGDAARTRLALVNLLHGLGSFLPKNHFQMIPNKWTIFLKDLG